MTPLRLSSWSVLPLFLLMSACGGNGLQVHNSNNSGVDDSGSAGCTLTQTSSSLTLASGKTQSNTYNVVFINDEGTPTVSGLGGFVGTAPVKTSAGTYTFSGTF